MSHSSVTREATVTWKPTAEAGGEETGAGPGFASPTGQPRSDLIGYLWTGEVALALLVPGPCGRLSQEFAQERRRSGSFGFLFLFDLLAGAVVFLCIY